MNPFKHLSTTLSRLWVWLRDNKTWVFSGIGVVVSSAFVDWVITDPPKHSSNITAGGNIPASAAGNSVAVGMNSGDLTINQISGYCIPNDSAI